MNDNPSITLSNLPAVDRVARLPVVEQLIAAHGRGMVMETLRTHLAALRAILADGGRVAPGAVTDTTIAADLQERLAQLFTPSLRPVFNLTGTVLHTNLGRAPLPAEAIAAVARVAAGASNLEYDLATGRRGDRHSHVEAWVKRLTGAEAAVVVNNNAAAVLLCLNSLAQRKQVPVSRGELIEIGGAFRMPDIMARAGCKLIEVGTTNRTHLKDYRAVVGERTALLMKVHTSNYVVQGFTAQVAESELAGLAHQHGLPMITDLGSGTLIDLTRYGLPRESTVREMIDAGVDLVTFSGDKLLGGPQAGIIAGRAALITRIKRNPMLRALRPGKMTLAALETVLRLYADPDNLIARVPALRLLTRARADIEAQAREVATAFKAALDKTFNIEVVECVSQIGSGALPVESLPSGGLRLSPANGKRGSQRRLRVLAVALRALPVPVIGRVHDGSLYLDLRCLDDTEAFVAQLRLLPIEK